MVVNADEDADCGCWRDKAATVRGRGQQRKSGACPDYDVTQAERGRRSQSLTLWSLYGTERVTDQQGGMSLFDNEVQ